MPMLLAIKILLFTLLIPGSVLVYVPYSLISAAPQPQPWPSLLLLLPAGMMILFGMSMYIRCAWDFAIQGYGTPAPVDPPKTLVINGLYQHSRNPMYQAVLLLLAAECFLFPASGLWIYACSIAMTFQIFIVFYEEPHLSKRFGQAYLDYCKAVPRWCLTWKLVRSTIPISR